MPTRRALIVGAGLSGLASAIGLRRAGFEVCVFEQAPALEPAGFGIGITSNGMKALDLLGAYEAVAREGCAPAISLVKTWRGALLREVDIAALGRKIGYETRIFHRADLQRALLSLLPPEVLQLGKRCEQVVSHPDGVEVRFSDGSSARGDCLIGADGINSKVRRCLHGDGQAPEAARFAEYVTWVATMELTHPVLRPGYNAHYWGTGARAGIHDIGGGRWYWWGTRNKAQVPARLRTMHMVACDDNRIDKDELLQHLSGWAPEVRHCVRATPAGRIFMIHTRDRAPLKSWGRGRVTLLGDAAHPMLTSLGQGACMGFEDAAVLVHCLTAEPSVPEALLRYERLRLPRTTQIVEATRRASAIEQVGNPLGARARERLMAWLPAAVVDRQGEAISAFELPDVFSTPTSTGTVVTSGDSAAAQRPEPVVVVTGASTGIGRAAAIYLARAGYHVLAGVRSQAAQDEMRGLGFSNLKPVILDVLEPATVAALVAEVEALAATGRRVIGLVNNAGIAVIAPLEAVDADTLQRQFGVNTTGVNVMIRALLPQLLAARGRIINVGSPVGSTRPPYLGPYAASKAALEALSDVWRRELSGTGVTLSLLVPGAVMTPVWNKMASSVEQLLEAGSGGLRDRHGAPLSRFVRLNEETAVRSELSPDDVAATVLEILRAKQPKHRYELGRGTSLARVAARVVPTPLIDAVFRRVLGRDAQETPAEHEPTAAARGDQRVLISDGLHAPSNADRREVGT